ncbi:hypothetical protein [Limnobacter sp.]|uniref:hypothetical protein n=1 Tax=Limnobacter sp. TaxID=2003368 RepID=UPI00258B439F|nr:hypothetical protein [Limnobacter sp.]MDP3189407.1 hypothetical protein [Limnobacter sp.]
MADIDVWELREAFAAQILVNLSCMALEEFANEYYQAVVSSCADGGFGAAILIKNMGTNT